MLNASDTKPISKSEAVYQELRRRIIEGRYVSGYRIVLDQIAREMGVSAVPVREAIRRLEAEKLVTFTRNVGAEVASIDVGDYHDAMQTLAYLEGAATSLAGPRLEAKDLDEAEKINDQMRQLLSPERFNAGEFTRLNMEFHRILCRACPNKHLRDLLDREWERVNLIRRSNFVFEPVRSQTSVNEHQNILDLIRQGAATDEVERTARNHKLRTLREFLNSQR